MDTGTWPKIASFRKVKFPEGIAIYIGNCAENLKVWECADEFEAFCLYSQSNYKEREILSTIPVPQNLDAECRNALLPLNNSFVSVLDRATKNIITSGYLNLNDETSLLNLTMEPK